MQTGQDRHAVVIEDDGWLSHNGLLNHPEMWVCALDGRSDWRAVEVHMANLRRKLSDSVGAPRFIETARGVGYRLTEPRGG